MTGLPEQLASFFHVPIGRERPPNKRAPNAAKASLGAIAAVAVRYDQANIDIPMRQFFYVGAKFYLDGCIEEDEVLGMHVSGTALSRLGKYTG
ncbi:uncharacterized protein Z518_02092 [Rhinocladiella mackenziei CBS 650.93]|uniref:Rhinocladiella mackenziei CBS 650.93 unplaced genomic scaffold supercont1.2, whole genome shotgun sequence n=1 Tax=Rhinocladiella mackenziei CBS 650.93 TaxID=1442369 RepID=A0A0D2INR3_9EURO|nr:uncharacterized protein Z518_02092 [Rhinocladiella mackenziei CBS 650.93]KIX07439.1 hypothetical protein Z518_02092 [Rhinocladiella mackenziei CBS 650.93]